MRKAAKTTLYGVLFLGSLIVSACSGSEDSDTVTMVDSDAGDALDLVVKWDSPSPSTSSKGVAPITSDAGETRTDADTDAAEERETRTDADTDAAEERETRTDADTADPELDGAAEVDGAVAPIDALVLESGRPDSADSEAGEVVANDGAAGCNSVGRWQVYINQSPIQCVNTQGSEGFFIDVFMNDCEQDLEISLDIDSRPGIWGWFVGTIAYHLSFNADSNSLTATAEISGTITNGAGSMQCETEAFVTGVRR